MHAKRVDNLDSIAVDLQAPLPGIGQEENGKEKGSGGEKKINEGWPFLIFRLSFLRACT